MSSTRTPASIELTARDLDDQGDIFCPSPKADMALWNGHPRVFLNVSRTGQASCPYCGTRYVLKAGEVFRGH